MVAAEAAGAAEPAGAGAWEAQDAARAASVKTARVVTGRERILVTSFLHSLAASCSQEREPAGKALQ